MSHRSPHPTQGHRVVRRQKGQEQARGLGQSLFGISEGKRRQGRIYSLVLANLNISGRLGVLGIPSGCLLPWGPWDDVAEEYCLLGIQAR